MALDIVSVTLVDILLALENVVMGILHLPGYFPSLGSPSRRDRHL